MHAIGEKFAGLMTGLTSMFGTAITGLKTLVMTHESARKDDVRAIRGDIRSVQEKLDTLLVSRAEEPPAPPVVNRAPPIPFDDVLKRHPCFTGKSDLA